MSKIQKFLARHTRAIIISLIVIILILGSLVGYLITAFNPSNLAKSVSQNQSSKSTEKLPEDNTQAINIKLKNENLFTKRVNNDETVKLERQQAELCGARNSLTYSIKEQGVIGDFETSMTIGSKENYLKDESLSKSYSQILNYLNDRNDNTVETLYTPNNETCYIPITNLSF